MKVTFELVHNTFHAVREDSGIWHIYLEGVEDIYVASVFEQAGKVVDGRMDENAKNYGVHLFLIEFSEIIQEKIDVMCRAAWLEYATRDDISEIASPLAEFETFEGQPIETIKSCMDSTAYVMAHDMCDLDSMVARMLANQVTIMANIRLLLGRK